MTWQVAVVVITIIITLGFTANNLLDHIYTKVRVHHKAWAQGYQAREEEEGG